MMSTAELESWCYEQMDRMEEEKAKKGEEDTPAPNDEEVPPPVVQPAAKKEVVRATIRGTEGFREVPREGQVVWVNVMVWQRSGELGDEPGPHPDESDAVASRANFPYEIGGAKSDDATTTSDDDDLDEWLQLPAACVASKAPWCGALDACLVSQAMGEVCVLETREWRVECELLEIMVEADVVDTSSARAQGVVGYAKTRRLSGRRSSGKDRGDGCVVYGKLRVVYSTAKELKPEWFGGLDKIVATLGDGKLAEGFDAALSKSCGPNTKHLVALGGDFLRGDDDPPQIGCLCVEVTVEAIDDSKSMADPMSLAMDLKEKRAIELKDRGARLWAAGRYRRAEVVWNAGVKLFNFIKPEDSGFDPKDVHLKENERGRRASIPLLLNEALAMRRRGDLSNALQNLNEAVENDGNHVKALYRRGQVRIDLVDWEGAKDDFRRCLDLGGPEAQVRAELKRLRKLERKQDAKDGKYFKDAFADDRDELYDDKKVDPLKVAKARDVIREEKNKPKPTFSNVVKKTTTTDWTASYSTKARPKIVSDAPEGSTNVVTIDDLDAEIEEIHDEEQEASRRAKEAYYNTQIGLGNMRLHLPPEKQ